MNQRSPLKGITKLPLDEQLEQVDQSNLNPMLKIFFQIELQSRMSFIDAGKMFAGMSRVEDPRTGSYENYEYHGYNRAVAPAFTLSIVVVNAIIQTAALITGTVGGSIELVKHIKRPTRQGMNQAQIIKALSNGEAMMSAAPVRDEVAPQKDEPINNVVAAQTQVTETAQPNEAPMVNPMAALTI